MTNKRVRKKGYSPYVDIPYESLGDYIGRKGLVRVSKSWLESLGYEIKQFNEIITNEPLIEEIKEEEKIEYKLTHFE